MSDEPQPGEARMSRRKALAVITTSAAACSAPSLLALPLDALLARAGAADALARRSLSNALRRGHCAPAILETLLPAPGDATPLLRLVGGLPGGIGDSGAECGGITATAVHLGLTLGGTGAGEIDRVLEVGRRFVRRFRAQHGSTDCRDIRNERRGITPCLRAIATSPGLLAQSVEEWKRGPPAEPDEARAEVLARMRLAGFHCAHAVLLELGGEEAADPILLRACCGFVGGALMLGGTCSALTAGVVAIGGRIGAVEGSRLRVLRMVGRMLAGGDAMADDVNGFNRTIRLAGRLLAWAAEALGATRCRELAGADLGCPAGCREFLGNGCLARCRTLPAKVAGQVRRIVAAAS